MSLLAPLFLLAGLAIALPFWLHRLNVQSAERQHFSSTMLLESTERQVHVRKQLRYFALLAMRVLALLVLALAFAKPLLTRSSPVVTDSASGSHLIVVDNSASMQRTDLQSLAIDAARSVLDEIPRTALVQVATAAARLRVLTEATAASAEHRVAIDSLSPGLERLDLGTAIAAVDELAAALPQPVTLHLISDFQQSGMPARFADVVPANVASLALHPIRQENRSDWRVDYVTVDGEVGLSVTGDASPARLRLSLNGQRIEESDIGQLTRLTFSIDRGLLEPGDNRLVAAIDTDDDTAANNRWHAVVSHAPSAPVPLVTAKPDGRGVTYLEAVLGADRDANRTMAIMPVNDTDFRTLERYPWALVDDMGALRGDVAAAVASYVEDGGNLLAFMGEATRAIESVPVTGHIVQPAATGARDGEFLTMGTIDSAHPVLAGTEGWQTVNVARNLDVTPAATDKVLMRLEDGTPFLIEKRLGQGRILLVTSGLDNEWNDLPVRPVFVGFMVEAARYLSGTETVEKSFTVGELLPLSIVAGSSGQVLDPAGNTVLALADTTRAQQVRLEYPGFYEVYTAKAEYLVAVNVDPRESDPMRITPETLARWQASVDGTARHTVSTSIAPEAIPVQLWPALLAALAVLLIGESLLGNRYFRPQAGREA